MTNGEALTAQLDALYETERADELRTHLGASVIGKECLRQIWLGFRWAKAKRFPGRMLRLFERGQREEAAFVGYLRKLGATVHTHDANGTQYRVSAVGGHFGGSLDGAAVNIPYVDGWAVTEFKTHNDKQFSNLVKLGVQVSHPEHYMQAQTYGFLAGLPNALYMAVNKNDDALHVEISPVLPYVGNRAIQKAETVIFSRSAPPRVADSPSSHKCRFCDFRDLCHGFEMPLVNCRTCVHASASPSGGWLCALDRAEIQTTPRTGCSAHVFEPSLFPHATVTERTAHFTVYMTRNKGPKVNGLYGEQSANLDLALT